MRVVMGIVGFVIIGCIFVGTIGILNVLLMS